VRWTNGPDGAVNNCEQGCVLELLTRRLGHTQARHNAGTYAYRLAVAEFQVTNRPLHGLQLGLIQDSLGLDTSLDIETMTASSGEAAAAQADGRAALEFIWEGQEGWFELAFRPDSRQHFSKSMH
jgi:hypothetical protein